MNYMIKLFKKKIIALSVLVNIMDDMYPFEFRRLAADFYNSHYTAEDKELISAYIDKVIKFTEDKEAYELSAELLKIKNSL